MISQGQIGETVIFEKKKICKNSSTIYGLISKGEITEKKKGTYDIDEYTIICHNRTYHKVIHILYEINITNYKKYNTPFLQYLESSNGQIKIDHKKPETIIPKNLLYMPRYTDVYLADNTNVFELDFSWKNQFAIILPGTEQKIPEEKDDIIFFKTLDDDNKIYYGHLCHTVTSDKTNLKILIPFLQKYDDTKTITFVNVSTNLVVDIDESKNMKAVHPDKIISLENYLNDNLSTLDDKPIEIYLNTQFCVCDRKTVQTITSSPTHDYRIFEIKKNNSYCKLFFNFILSIYKKTLPVHAIVNIIDSKTSTFNSLFTTKYLIIIDNKENKVETKFPLAKYLDEYYGDDQI